MGAHPSGQAIDRPDRDKPTPKKAPDHHRVGGSHNSGRGGCQRAACGWIPGDKRSPRSGSREDKGSFVTRLRDIAPWIQCQTRGERRLEWNEGVNDNML